MITEIRLDTQALDATLIPSKISTAVTDDFTFPRDVKATARLRVGNGTASLPTLTFESDLNTGFYNQAADSIGAVAGGTEYLRIQPARITAFNTIRTASGGSPSAPNLEIGSSGNTGISSSGSTDMQFAIGGSTRMSHNSVQWESFSPFRFTAGSVGVAAISLGSDPTTGLFHPSAGIIAISSSSTEVFRVDSTNLTSQGSILIKSTTNQLTLGTTNTTTITSPAPAASRTYTLPDAGTNSTILLADGTQSINGQQTFTADVYIAKQANVSDADLFITSRVGVASPAVGGNFTMSAGDYPGSNNTSQATSGTFTITTRGVSNAALPVAQGGSILLTSGGSLVNVSGASAESRGGGITLTSGDVSQTFGSGAVNKTRGGSIILTAGQCATSSDDLGGNITLTSFTAANGGSIILTGTGAIGTPGSPAKGNIYANHSSLEIGSAASPAYTFTGDTNTGIYEIAADTIGIATAGVEAVRVTSAGDVTVAQNVRLADTKKVILGNSDNAFILYDNATGHIRLQTLGTGGSSGAANVKANNRLTFEAFNDPNYYFQMASSFVALVNDSSAIRLNVRFLDTLTSGFNDLLNLDTSAANVLHFGYKDDGSSKTSATIQSQGGLPIVIETSGTSDAVTIANAGDVSILSDKKFILGNSGNAFWKFDSSGNVIQGQTVAAGHLYIGAAGTMSLYANTASSFFPVFTLDTDGSASLQVDGTPGPTSKFSINADQGVSVVGFNPTLNLLNPGGGEVYIGYDSDGSSVTGTRIRGANLTVESFSPLYLEAASVNVSGKILNQDGSLGAPAYSFVNDATSGMFRGSFPEVTLVAGGLDIADFRTTMIRAHKPLQMNSNEINTVSVISVADGGASAPSYTFGSDTAMGMYRDGAQYLAFAVEGVSHTFLTTDTSASSRPGNTGSVLPDTGIDLVMSGQIQTQVGSATNPDINLSSNQGQGFYRISSNVIGVATTGVERARFDDNGIKLTDGTLANPSYSFTNEVQTGFFLADSSFGTVGIVSKGVGIGFFDTESITGRSGVDGTFSLSGLDSSVIDLLVNDGRMQVGETYDVVWPSISVTSSANGGGITAPNSTDLSLVANGVDRARVTSTGIVMQGSSTLNMGTNKITNLANPTSDQDAATKYYVDAVATGLILKESVRVATNAALPAYTAAGSGVGKTLTANAVGVLTVDGVATVLGDRILVKNQAPSHVDHGIYSVTTQGTAGVAFVLTRSTDFDGTPVGEVKSGDFTFVTEGTVWSDTGWVLSTINPITIDTTALAWTQFSSAGVINGGAGILQTGETLDIVSADDSMTINADSIQIKRDGTGAIGLSASGIKVNVDNSSIEISTNALRVKAAGITYAMSNVVTRETPSGTVDGSNMVFTLAFSAAAGSEMVFLNGVLQDVGGGNDYTISGATITFVTAPITGSKIRVTYWKA